MPWFKVDDKLHDHRKARAAGSTAMGVWLLAGSWAADNLTDGFVPAAILPRWGRPRDANRLVEVGLWHADEQDGEKGWRFHEWAERQPTRAQKLEERAIRAEAGRAGGKASGRSRREANAKQSASGGLEPPSRPVPSRPTDAYASVAADAADSDPLDRFDEFWDIYAKKVDRKKAEAKWRLALKRTGVTPDLLIESARAYVTWERANNEGGRFIMDPARWLNGHRWEDERPARQAVQHQGRASQWLQLAADLGEPQPPSNIREIGQGR